MTIHPDQKADALRLLALLDQHPEVYVEVMERTGAAVFTDGEHVLVLTDIAEREDKALLTASDAQRREFLERWIRNPGRRDRVRGWLISQRRFLRVREHVPSWRQGSSGAN